MTRDAIRLLVALPAEAKPLIRAFGLRRRQPDGAFPRYDNGALTLLLTGPGMQAAAGAAAFAHELNPDPRGLWINLGIAGHSSLAPGSGLLAERVTEAGTSREWQLNPVRGLAGIRLTPLHCVGEAETDYASPGGYDMESAAIAGILAGFGLLPRLQILKVVSDNPHHPSRQINARMVSQLIERLVPTLDTLISRLQTHAQSR